MYYIELQYEDEFVAKAKTYAEAVRIKSELQRQFINRWVSITSDNWQFCSEVRDFRDKGCKKSTFVAVWLWGRNYAFTPEAKHLVRNARIMCGVNDTVY